MHHATTQMILISYVQDEEEEPSKDADCCGTTFDTHSSPMMQIEFAYMARVLTTPAAHVMRTSQSNTNRALWVTITV